MNNLPPFQQGGLDSLCGLYSIINAERLINHSSDESTQHLFDNLISFLARRNLLGKFFVWGMLHRDMTMILNVVKSNNRITQSSIPFYGKSNPNLDVFWKYIQKFLSASPKRAVILGMQGYHDHWTVIEKITNQSILLYDSALIKRLSRSSCTTSDATWQRKHVLLPAQTYFLSNEISTDIAQYDT